MIWKNLTASVKIFTSPGTLFEGIKEQPRWGVTFVVIAILSVLLGLLLLPFKQEIALSHLSIQLGEVQARQVISSINQIAIGTVLFTPVALVIKWIVITALIYYSAILFGSQQIKFKGIFSVVVHSELIFILMACVNILILEGKWYSGRRDLTDTQMIIGLEYYFQGAGQNIYLVTIARTINTFTVWYGIVLTIGISIVGQLQRWKSAVIVSTLWLLGAGFQSAVLFITSGVKGMMGRW
ncbi:MAG: YIP1 family protein [Bacteroidota bacterium]|jgi:hypothetical protein